MAMKNSENHWTTLWLFNSLPWYGPWKMMISLWFPCDFAMKKWWFLPELAMKTRLWKPDFFRRHLWGRHGAHDPGLVVFCWSGKPFLLQGIMMPIPSGNLTKSYGKSPFFMGKSTISMASVHCYGSSPEGIRSMMLVSVSIRSIWPYLTTKPISAQWPTGFSI